MNNLESYYLKSYQHKRPTIGVLAGWQFAWTETPFSYLEPIFNGVCIAAQNLDCNVLLGCGIGPWTAHQDSLRPAWPLVSGESDFVPIGPWNTDGLIIINPLHSQRRSKYLQELIATGHPVIFIASGEQGPTVLADNRDGILQAIHHLVEHGHRSIAFIAGTPDDMEGDSGERLLAYYDAVADYGLQSDPNLVAWGHHVYRGGYSATREILTSGVPFTALLASNDESALGAMQALKESQLKIPQDIALIGFDDRLESAAQEPALTSVRVPLLQMGQRATESLYQYIVGETKIIESVRIPVHLVTRRSCGCPSHANIPSSGIPQSEVLNKGKIHQKQLIETIAASMMNKAQNLTNKQVHTLCQRLVEAFMAGVEQENSPAFLATLEAILQQVVEHGDEMHTWQTAISQLSGTLETLTTVWSRPEAHAIAQTLLDQARITISTHIQRQNHQYIADRRWMLNRLGTLTANLLAAHNEQQVYEVLAQHLPAMNIYTTWIALFDAEGDDPVAWTTLRTITDLGKPQYQFHSREFPPAEMLTENQTYSLALFPLTGPRGQLGFAVFNAVHLDLCGAITQQLATALNSVQLYREATEGRRLAEEANELKSRFLSTVSHELRTPLNLIIGLSGVLLQESCESSTPLTEEYQADVEQIYASAQLLSGLIGDVLDLASSDAGQLRLAHEFIDLSKALRLVAKTGQRLAYDKGLAWHANLPLFGPWVWGDQIRLRQIALNLINNAIKFTEQGEVRLELKTDPEFGSVTVSVSDTGMGIPIKEQRLIFDEFRRSKESLLRGYSGLGLGLAICKRLVKMHGGIIGVHSSGKEGEGSTFYFTLPIVQPPRVQPPPDRTSPPTVNSILLLTQRGENKSRLLKYLKDHDFNVLMIFIDEVSNWLSQIVTTPPDAIMIDIDITPYHGWDLLKTIKGHPKTQDVPVLFCSFPQDSSGAIFEFDYLTKPIELTQLTQALDRYWIPPHSDQDFTTILIVDDDPKTLEMHARIVQTHSTSHHVLKAQNGLEALDILRQEHIDLVLLDLMMPKLDGFGVLEIMREDKATRDIPVIVLTGQVLTHQEMQHLNQGVATILSKGMFNFEETLNHINTTLQRNRELSNEASRLVRLAMAYIHEHYTESISRVELAQSVALSEDYLTFCFRKELGITPVTYLNRFRINQAQELLTQTHKSITEIAFEVGFSDSSYFSRIFRREVGMSPTAYRQISN
ncbi:MAG: substrate-binding domain-containing protein [Anaerolineae bacterium]|nr:substrate-binding domain-containing protein [Anaerolineae bacterium]